MCKKFVLSEILTLYPNWIVLALQWIWGSNRKTFNIFFEVKKIDIDFWCPREVRIALQCIIIELISNNPNKNLTDCWFWYIDFKIRCFDFDSSRILRKVLSSLSRSRRRWKLFIRKTGHRASWPGPDVDTLVRRGMNWFRERQNFFHLVHGRFGGAGSIFYFWSYKLVVFEVLQTWF